MNIVSVCFDLVTLFPASLAAWYWHKSSKVELVPPWVNFNHKKPVLPLHDTRDLILGMIEAGKESSRLNSIAAIWTAISIMAGFMSTVANIVLN